MVSVSFTVGGTEAAPATVRDATMAEVWRGMLDRDSPLRLNLAPGAYVVDIARLEGPQRTMVVVPEDVSRLDFEVASDRPQSADEGESAGAEPPVPDEDLVERVVGSWKDLVRAAVNLTGTGLDRLEVTNVETSSDDDPFMGPAAGVGLAGDAARIRWDVKGVRGDVGETVESIGMADVGRRMVVTDSLGGARVVDPDREEPVVLPGKVVSATLDAEGSHVIAELPGRRAAVFDLRTAKPRRIGVAWLDAVLARSSDRPRAVTAGSVKVMPAVRLSPAWMRDIGPPIHVALWSRRDGGRWTLDVNPDRDSLREGPEGLRFLRISGTGREPVLVALPRVVARIQVKYKTTRFGVRVVDADDRAELMLRLLQRRETRTAATLAASRLHTKQAEPIGAAEGALALVRLFSELEPRPPWSWFGNLAEGFPWLPDGRIAWVWYGLYAGKLDAQQARDGLIEAYGRGVPVMTSALTLLLDGLELAAQQPDDDEVRSALAKVRTWVAAADPDATRTQLAGSGRRLFGGPAREAATTGNLRGVSFTQLGAVASGEVLSLELDPQDPPPGGRPEPL